MTNSTRSTSIWDIFVPNNFQKILNSIVQSLYSSNIPHVI